MFLKLVLESFLEVSEFLQGKGHPQVKSNTPLQVEVNVPKMRPCKLRATFFTQENFATLKHRPSYGLDDDGEVLFATCNCKVGQGPCHKYVGVIVAACLYSLLDFVSIETKEVPEDVTSILVAEKWHVPSQYDITLTKAAHFHDLAFEKAIEVKEQKKQVFDTSYIVQHQHLHTALIQKNWKGLLKISGLEILTTNFCLFSSSTKTKAFSF